MDRPARRRGYADLYDRLFGLERVDHAQGSERAHHRRGGFVDSVFGSDRRLVDPLWRARRRTYRDRSFRGAHVHRIRKVVNDCGQTFGRGTAVFHGMAFVARGRHSEQIWRDNTTIADLLRAILLPLGRIGRNLRCVILLDIWQLLRSGEVVQLTLGNDPL